MFPCVVYVIFILTSCVQISLKVSATSNTLLQVHVLFRHGDRTPDLFSLYPKDPHLNDTWFPYGHGALTNLGKKQEYELGRSLRKRYGSFLGDLYLQRIQEARSTNVARTKMSLQLVLAALWPPNDEQTFIGGLPWQPIDYDFVPFEKDTLLGIPFLRPECTNYKEEFKKSPASEQALNYLEENKEKIEYINTNSGLHVKTAQELWLLYFGLFSEEHTNRTLPDWTKSIYPEFLEESAIFNYELQISTNDMLKASGGPLVKKILQDAKDKIQGITPRNEKKINLYSAHEFNIVHTLAALKCFKPHVPPYSSHIIFELHEIDTKYGFEIYYQDTHHEEPALLKIPGCEEFCPVDEFELLMKDVMPDFSYKC